MSSYFTKKTRTLSATAFIEYTAPKIINKWIQGTSYNEGAVVYYNQNKYIAKSSGISGTIPPTHVNGTVSDGVISWIWFESFQESTLNKNMYLFIGKSNEWSDENSPDNIRALDIDEQNIINDIVTLKKVSTDNFRLGINRVNWTTNTVYSSFDSRKDPLAVTGQLAYTNPFFVITDESNIYKCIDNNNGAVSSIKPTSTSVNQFYLSDGYVWKFMGKLDVVNTSFLTQSTIPVTYKSSDDGSDQWQVQQAAKSGSISTFELIKSVGSFADDTIIDIVGGSPTTSAQAYITKKPDNTINQVLVQANNIGLGYSSVSPVYALIKASTSTGSGAQVTAVNVVNGVIQSLTFSAGSGYTGGAVCFIIDEIGTPNIPAVVDVVISSGSVSALNVTSGGDGYSQNVKAFIVPGTSAGLARAIFAPKDGHGANILNELNARTAILSVSLNDTTGYLLFGDSSDYRQIGLISNVYDFGQTGSSKNSLYIGPSHPLYNTTTLNRMDKSKGDILYICNRTKVIRSVDQEETIKLTIKF